MYSKQLSFSHSEVRLLIGAHRLSTARQEQALCFVLHEKVASVQLKWLSSYAVTGIYKILLICPLDDPVAGKLGGEVLLKPKDVAAEITSITWKQGPNLAVQWDGTAINFYRQFKSLLDWSLWYFLPLCKLPEWWQHLCLLTARSTLDVKTGILTLRNLELSDSNNYTPEINNALQSEIVLKVYREWMSLLAQSGLFVGGRCL